VPMLSPFTFAGTFFVHHRQAATRQLLETMKMQLLAICNILLHQCCLLLPFLVLLFVFNRQAATQQLPTMMTMQWPCASSSCTNILSTFCCGVYGDTTLPFCHSLLVFVGLKAPITYNCHTKGLRH